MNQKLLDFTVRSVSRATALLAEHKAKNCTITVSSADSKVHLALATHLVLSIQYTGGRHGCGPEQDGYWARALSGGDEQGFSLVKVDANDLAAPIAELIAQECFSHDLVSLNFAFESYPNYPQQPGFICEFQKEETPYTPWQSIH